jgi:hypothetical protein
MFETYLRGYASLEKATERYLVGRRALLRARLEEHRPTLAALASHAPTAAARVRAQRAEAEARRLFGPMDATTRAKSGAVQVTALAEALRLATVGSARQPPTVWTGYRMEQVPAATKLRSRVELTVSTQLNRLRAAFAQPDFSMRG